MKAIKIICAYLLTLSMFLSLALCGVTSLALADEEINLLGTWDGTYSGTTSGGSIIRNIQLNIDYCADGIFEGMAIIDSGSNGRYFFKGTVQANNEIMFSGDKWLVNPSNFGFAFFSGVIDSSGTSINGIIDGDSNRLFSLTKTSEEFFALSVDYLKLPKTWKGEYDGHSGSIVVRRDYELIIQEISESGTVTGKAIFSPSEQASAEYGANGSYFFRGTIDSRTGKIEIQGYEWIDYPIKHNNFTFVLLTGVIINSDIIIGTTEDGIWNMKAVDPSEVDNDSGFTLGRDNNNFVHTPEATWDGAGFVGVNNYSISIEYYNRLTASSNKSERSKIQEEMAKEWNGSCYGIAMSMGMLFENKISIEDLSDSDAEDYYHLPYPSMDSKFLNMINYYQLSQFVSNGGKKNAAISRTYQYDSFSRLEKWLAGGDSLSVFLKKLVENASNSNTLLMGFSTSDGGHAVLVVGCHYNKTAGIYNIDIYDENTVMSSNSIGSILQMEVHDDYSQFSLTGLAGEDVLSTSTYESMYFLDWDKVDNALREAETNYTQIYIPAHKQIRITNNDSDCISYDGTSFEGNMAVYGIDFIEYNNESTYVLSVDSNESYSFISDAGNIDISVVDENGFSSINATSTSSAVVKPGYGFEIESENADIYAFMQLNSSADENEAPLVSFNLHEAGKISTFLEGNDLKVESDKSFIIESTAYYHEVERETHYYYATTDSLIVSSSGVIIGIDEVLIGDLNFDNHVNTADAVFVLKNAAGMMQLDNKQNMAGDCNHDGKVNTADAVLILKYAAGMITEF